MGYQLGDAWRHPKGSAPQSGGVHVGVLTLENFRDLDTEVL